MTATLLLAAATTAPPLGNGGIGLVPAALLGMAVVVGLITRFKVNPFLALTLGGLTVGAAAGLPLAAVVESFGKGFGATAAGVGTLVALGAMFGKLLADSGGADEIVDTIVGRASPRALPWAMAAVGALIGLPMFFEIGLLLLMPVIFLVAQRSGVPLIRLGIPALAGLSAMHALVPPHPGPLVAVSALKADLGITLMLGVLISIPVIIIAGPLFGQLAGNWVGVPPPHTFDAAPGRADRRRPSFGATMTAVLLPIALMMGKALADILLDPANPVRHVLDFIGMPLIALLIAVIAGVFLLGLGAGMDRDALADTFEKSLPPIAGTLLIIAAGGGFKQTLVDSGIGALVASWVQGSGLSVMLVGWFVAVLIRLATGSATVATVTASGILAPLATGLSPAEISLLVFAIGSGSVFLSHVNDVGFWMVKEFFGLTVGETFKTWSAMETILSVTGLLIVLLLDLFL